MKVFLSKLWKGVALFLVCVMVGVTFMPYLVFENNADARKKQAFQLQAATSSGTNGGTGTEANPFTILEIVPYHDMAQMLWLSEETMPKLESDAVYTYRDERNQSTFQTGLSGLCSADQDPNKKFDQKTAVVDRSSFNTNIFSQSVMYFNKPQKDYNDDDFSQILKMYGYTGTTYFNGNDITPDGRTKAIKLIKNFRTTGQQQHGEDFNENSNDYYESRVEKIHNNEIFKRMIIGIESDVVKEEWAKWKLIQEGTANPSPADISAKVASFSIANNSAEYISIRNQSNVKQAVLDKCRNFYIRVIVATPDEVNKSVANPSNAVDTVAVFPEKVNNGTYQTYTANPNKSLIGMADLVFYVDKFTNTETGYMYDYFAKDATARSNPSAKCPNYSGFNYNEVVGNHYKYDLSAKAANEMFIRMVGGTSGTQKKLPVIISITSYNQTGIWNSTNSNHNIAKIMYLEYAYLFSDAGFSASNLLGRLSYNTGAGYNGADSPASDNAYKLKFKFDNGTVKEAWGGGDFFAYIGSSTPTKLCGVHYLPYQPGNQNPVENGNLGVLNGSVFLFNADENFNKQILEDKYSNSAVQFQATQQYISGKQIVTHSSAGMLTPADVIMGILGFEGSVQPISYNNIRVLEIQPCASFEKEEVTDDDERKAQLEIMYRKILPNYVGDITIDQMSSIEFNGMVDDVIENYDLIYFGMRTKKLNTNSAGNTIYNDTSLNGKVYLHTGDRIPLGQGPNANYSINGDDRHMLLRGSLAITNAGQLTHATENGRDASDVYRYAGNDITRIKEEQLEDYVKSGHCVVFDKSFFEIDSSGSVVMGTANDNKIDNTSNIYDFVSFCAKQNTESNTYKYIGVSVFGVDFTSSSVEIGNSLETGLASAPYVKISMISAEPEYANAAAFSEGGVSESDGIKKVTNTSNQLNFKFEIYTANIPGNFKADVYVDTLHDGSFTSEDLTGNTISGIHTTNLSDNTAPSGDQTTITVPLPPDYIGMVPWKILVYEDSADPDMAGLKRASVTGYTAVKRSSDEIETINVLQILSSQKHKGTKGSVDLKNNAKFNKYAADDVLGPAVGYNIHIEQVYIDELLTKPEFFGNISDASELEDKSKNAFLKKNANNKNVYDMLLLGFDDGYGFKNYVEDTDRQEIVLKAIDQYIDNEYAVLLSHDNLSFFNYRATNSGNRDGYYSGYYMNHRLREKLAADRYGVYLKEEERTGKDVPYKAGSASPANPSGVAIEAAADWDAVTSSTSKGIRTSTTLYNHTQMQGFTDGVLDCIADTCNARSRGWKLSTNYTGHLQFANDPNGKTTKIQQTNKGQVTLFPYVIDQQYDSTDFPVSETHCQYYQLDMEREDLVVWYTLDSSSISSYYGYNGPDPRNNYYIYNTNNITYTGMGHSGDVSDKEVKLFINTMIAAYRAGNAPAYSILRNDGAATSSSGSEKQYLYVDYDTFSDAGGSAATIISTDLAKDPVTDEPCVKVLYSVLDNNMLFNKKVYVSPIVFSHTTKGDINRAKDIGVYTKKGSSDPIGPDVYSSIDNYKDAELSSGGAIALYVRDVRTNVYEVDNDGSIGAQVGFEDVTIGGGTTKAIPVQSSANITSSTKIYCTYLPLKYFKEDGVDYNDIYLSLSCMILYGMDNDRKVLYGDGNMVSISKRELFDLR